VIRSMTGFGRASFVVEGAHFDVEVRTVNHRFLDASVRLPRMLSAHESEMRPRIAERMARGKVDLTVSLAAGTAPAPRLEVDAGAASQYVAAAARLSAEHDLPGELDVAALLGLPGVARTIERELAEAPLRSALLAAVDAALDAAVAMRTTEGASLERELRARLVRIEELAEEIGGRSDSVAVAARERLRKRAEQLGRETGLVDEARLAQEIVIAADRLDITEERVRLTSHVAQFRQILDESGPGKPAGRRLDFLLQELGREANTIGSKGGDAPIAHLVVELKTELERVREQVQNVE